MKQSIAIFQKHETPVQSLFTDTVTFGFLLVCIWFSWHMGGGWWTFFTCTMFLIWLRAKGQLATWVKLETKQQALDWANALPDDTEGGAA